MRTSCTTDDMDVLKPAQVKALIDSDEQGDFILLDVRQPGEYVEGHIPGAILIPLGELEKRYGELDRNCNIVTYCRSGHRSMSAAVVLCWLGFDDVGTMEGGFLDWNYDVLKGMPEDPHGLLFSDEGLGNALVTALKLEDGSRRFYLKAMENVSSGHIKKVFEKLASVEGKHMDALYSSYLGVIEGGGSSMEELLKTDVCGYMEGGIKVDKALLDIGDMVFKDELEVLEVALEKEYLSYDLYKRIAGDVPSDIRDLIYDLAAQEQDHIKHLMERVESLVGV